MSAYVVDRGHIRYLVTAMLSTRINRYPPFSWWWDGERRTLAAMNRDEASRIGQMLWDENIRSVQGRYPDCKGKPESMPGPIDEVFIYAHSMNHHGSPDPVQVLKACDCYEYQSCEHSEWESSQAKAIIDTLRRHAWQALPGYEDAAWGAPEKSKPSTDGPAAMLVVVKPAATAAKATVELNAERGGVEIHFPTRPNEEVLADLRAHGWRWNRLTRCWYKRQGPGVEEYAREVAAKS